MILFLHPLLMVSQAFIYNSNTQNIQRKIFKERRSIKLIRPLYQYPTLQRQTSSLDAATRTPRRRLQRISDLSSSSTKKRRKAQKSKRDFRAWNEYYPKLKEYFNENGHCNVTIEDDEDLYAWTNNLRRRYKYYDDIPSTNKLEALQDIDFFWGDSDSTKRQRKWDECFPKLMEFYSINGHSNVSKDDDEDLCTWISSLRMNYRQQAMVFLRKEGGDLSSSANTTKRKMKRYEPQLSNEQLRLLSEVDFSWYVRSPQTQLKTWEEYYPKLKSYYKRNGHSDVQPEDDHDLYDWTVSLRKNHRRRRSILVTHSSSRSSSFSTNTTTNQNNKARRKSSRHTLSEEQVEALKDLDFSWFVEATKKQTNRNKRSPETKEKFRQANEEKWRRMFERLSTHARDYGDCSLSTMKHDTQLYYWAQRQRKEYRRVVSGQPSTLTENQIEALEGVGFEWGKSHDIRWRERLQELEAFQQIYGHSDVPQEFDENLKLANWVMNQRTAKRLKTEGQQTGLRGIRIRRLEQLQFVWNMKDRQWWSMYDQLKEYQQQNGNLTIDTSDWDRASLRIWLNEQRHFYHSEKFRHRLTQERINALESIPGFQWTMKEFKAPTRKEWSKLLGAIRERGITPETRPKQHWFEGVNPFKQEVKSVWTDEELLALWNEENDDDEDDDFYIEDEDSRNFLRA
jgi:hypothetical protein